LHDGLAVVDHLVDRHELQCHAGGIVITKH
jgi:hypothetical protein